MSFAVVYRFYDADGRLLYIGMTTYGATRWTDHSRLQPWWERVALVKVAHFADILDAAEEEVRAIRDEMPEFNITRYDNTPRNRGIYAPRGTGSVYRATRTGKWIASIRRHGRRFTSRGFDDRADAEAWLREFLTAQSA